MTIQGSGMRYLSVLLCLSLIAGLTGLFAGAKQALGAVTRVAVVKEIKGTVMVKKSGGSKAFNAFKNMSLNEGDALTTGKGGKVVLELASSKADQDSITVGENSQLNFSELKEDGGTKAKMNVWAGSMWVKVKSISNADDQFEVETPTAIMGVRGTYFFVGVDPNVGTTDVVVTSGVVAAQVPLADIDNTREARDVLIYPTQQGTFAQSSDGQVNTAVAAIDLDTFVEMTPPDILEAIIADAAGIDAEAEALAQNWTSETGSGPAAPTTNAADLQRIVTNMSGLVNNIARTSVDQNKVTAERVNRIAAQANGEAQKVVLDINNVKPLELTPDDLAKQGEAKRLAAEAEQKKREELARLEERRRALEQLIAQAAAEAARIAAANAAAQQEKTQQASQQYVSQLPSEEQQAFEQNNRQRRQEISTPPTQTPPTQTPPTQTPPAVPSASGSLSAASVANPSVSTGVILNINLANFNGAGKQIYGYQVDVEFDLVKESDTPKLIFNDDEFKDTAKSYRKNELFKTEPGADWALPYTAESVDYYFWNRNAAATTGKLTYAVVKFTGDPVAIGSTQSVVQLPFLLKRINAAALPAPKFKVTVTAVDSAGNIMIKTENTVTLTIAPAAGLPG